MCKSAVQAVPSRMQFTLHATRPTSHGALRLVQAMSTWSVKTRRAPSQRCRDARIYDHIIAAIHDIEYPLPPPSARLPYPPQNPAPSLARFGPNLFLLLLCGRPRLRTGKMVLLAEQQLVDCAGAYDNHGCNGGLPSHAFEYIASAGGIDTEEAYPYLAEGSGSCSFEEAGVGADVLRSVNITFQDEAELLEAVGNTGPVSVAFQVKRLLLARHG